MYDRKQLKKTAKQTIKHHYFLMVALCLIGSFLLNGVSSTASAMVSDATENKTAETDIGSNKILGSSTTYEVIQDLFSGDVDDAKKTAEEKKDEYKNEQDTSSNRFGHTEGVLAQVVNNLSSGSFFVTVFSLIDNITSSTDITLVFILIGAGLVYLFYTFFICGIYGVIQKRMILEAGVYEKVPLSHSFYMFFTKKNFKAALALLKMNFYLLLWWCTIVGGIIKNYSYAMVEYILAENPDMSGSEAMTLSRKMMDGHKWEFFKLQMSMIGWDILDVCTMGLAGIFFVNPYEESVQCEYYQWLRGVCKENNVEGIEALNDQYLYELADETTLQTAYADITEDQQYIEQNDIQLKGIRKFFAENFALWIGSSKEKKEYQNIQNLKHTIEADELALNHTTYPMRLSPLYKPSYKKSGFSIQYIRCYTIWSLILFFFLFSFVGWCWEVILMLITIGKFVNRGLLMGPWLPIYGTGGLVALLLLARLRKHPPLCFIGAIVLSGILEYSTAWYLETAYHQKWWDYTGYFLNLDGRICAEGLLVFGIGCSLVIFIIGPLFDSFISKRNPKIIIPLSIILLIIFGCDTVYSHFHPNEGEGVTGSLQQGEAYDIQSINQTKIQLS